MEKTKKIENWSNGDVLIRLLALQKGSSVTFYTESKSMSRKVKWTVNCKTGSDLVCVDRDGEYLGLMDARTGYVSMRGVMATNRLALFARHASNPHSDTAKAWANAIWALYKDRMEKAAQEFERTRVELVDILQH